MRSDGWADGNDGNESTEFAATAWIATVILAMVVILLLVHALA